MNIMLISSGLTCSGSLNIRLFIIRVPKIILKHSPIRGSGVVLPFSAASPLIPIDQRQIDATLPPRVLPRPPDLGPLRRRP